MAQIKVEIIIAMTDAQGQKLVLAETGIRQSGDNPLFLSTETQEELQEVGSHLIQMIIARYGWIDPQSEVAKNLQTIGETDASV